MYIGFAREWFMQASDRLGRQHSHGNFLRDDRFAVSHPGLVEGRVVLPVFIVIDYSAVWESMRCARRTRSRYDGKGENGQVVFLCEADLCGGGVEGGF